MKSSLAIRKPVVGMLKALATKNAAKDYAYIGGGFVLGSTVPRFVARGLNRIGILPATFGEGTVLAVGVGSAGLIGIGTQLITKDLRRTTQVIGGALAATLGQYIVMKLEEFMPMSGLGDTADQVRRAVEREIARQSGVGQFVSQTDVDEAPSVSQFLTTEEVEDAMSVSGMGLDVEAGAQAFDGFDGGAF